jgi:predicted nucleic acid-binding protein
LHLVVDTNVLFAAILRDSTARRILLTSPVHFLVPRYAFEELYEHFEEICLRNGLTEDANRKNVSIIHDNIDVIETKELLPYLDEAIALLKGVDPDDAPILAAAMSAKCDGIWSDDPHLMKQWQVKVWKTRDLIHFTQNGR